MKRTGPHPQTAEDPLRFPEVPVAASRRGSFTVLPRDPATAFSEVPQVASVDVAVRVDGRGRRGVARAPATCHGREASLPRNRPRAGRAPIRAWAPTGA